MVTVGNILTPVLGQQVNALQSTSQALEKVQLQLATGKSVSSALDDPNNFFTALSLRSRSGDLSRLIDGIGQSIRTVELADIGVRAALNILDQAEAFALDIENKFLSGELSPVDTAGLITARVDAVLASNPNAIHLGGGLIAESFTNVGTVTFTPPTGVEDVTYLIVGGGGGGGTSTSFSTAGGGGGGAGGVLTGSITVSNQSYDVVVGGGGSAGAAGNNSGNNGGDSSFGVNAGANLIGIGGGFGIGGNGTGGNGGSGGGGRGGGPGTSIQIISPQGGLGNDGGSGPSPGGNGGGGGGGAGGAGGALSAVSGGTGGDGFTSMITGAPITVGGGGGGGGANNDAIGIGGTGGGGNGANDATAATAGLANTGGGGGGGNNNRIGAPGGSGLVVLQYQLTALDTAEITIEEEYQEILSQLDLLAIDANYRGINLLQGEDLTTFFNENFSSFLVTEGIDASADGLGVTVGGFFSAESARDRIDLIKDARTELREFGSTLANDLSIITSRETFTVETVNTLEAGSDDLTVADQNQLGAEFLALQTRQAVQFNVLSLAAQSERQVVDLVRRA